MSEFDMFTNDSVLNEGSGSSLMNYVDKTGNDTGHGYPMLPNTSHSMLDTYGKLSSDIILHKMNQEQFKILTPSFILTCVLLVLGIPGNILALLVYLTKMKRNTASYFIITLALSDLVNCVVSLPVELVLITNFWTFDFPWLCRMSRYITAAMNNTSSFVLAAIAVERFRSICTPLKPRFTSLFSKVICATLMFVAILSALPMLWGYGTYTHKFTKHNISVIGKTCLIDDDVISTSYPHWLLVYFFIGHIVIFLILAVLYACIARRLVCAKSFTNTSSQNVLLQRQMSTFSVVSFSARSTSLRTPVTEDPPILKRSPSRVSTNSQNNIDLSLSRKHGGHHLRTRRLTCMLFLVTSVFEISFIPYLVIVAMRNSDPVMYGRLSDAGKMAFNFFLRFYLINCAVNPIIYCFYNQNFRHGVRRLFQSIKESFSTNIKESFIA